MSNITNTPHDTFFKDSFQDTERVKELIQANLPEKILKRIDLNSLQLTNNEFITPECASLRTDITYRCNIDGKDGYIYTLIEHQSTPDELIALRLQEYN